jgi:DNA-directed RNA polymerase subunit RPC12/RpoP
MATCPDCDYEEIDTDDLEEGDALSCPECGRKLVLGEEGDLQFADGDDDLDEDDDEEEEEEEEEDDDDAEDDDLDDLDEVEDEDEEEFDE